MSILELCESTWRTMTPADRQDLLEEINRVTAPVVIDTEGQTLSELAAIPNYHDLPSDARGRLIMAITDNGFTIAEYTRLLRR
jgi:hypothetical protein